MTVQTAGTDYVREQFARLQARNGAPDWLSHLRRQAVDSFQQQGFPTTRMEDWRFTDVKPIREATFDLAALPEQLPAEAALRPYLYGGVAGILLVFVDGHYCESLSTLGELPEGVTVSPLADALGNGVSEPLKQHLGSQASIETNAFTALNTGFTADGAFIHLAPGAVLDTPVHLLYVASEAADGVMSHPRNLIIAERNAEVTVLESYIGLGGGAYWTNAVTEIVLGDNAGIDHYRTQREGQGAYHISATQAYMTRDARLTSHAVTLGGSLSRNSVYATMDGENGVCTLNGLYLGSGRQLVDNHTTIEHAKPHCNSYEVYKGILDDRAHGVFNGKIHVQPDAQLTDAKQTNRALLLSNRARINTKPELLIFADDVKCTHGATIGQLDREALFYLQTRGIDRAEASAILTAAFGGEAIDDMRLEVVREAVSQMMLERFTRTKE